MLVRTRSGRRIATRAQGRSSCWAAAQRNSGVTRRAACNARTDHQVRASLRSQARIQRQRDDNPRRCEVRRWKQAGRACTRPSRRVWRNSRLHRSTIHRHCFGGRHEKSSCHGRRQGTRQTTTERGRAAALNVATSEDSCLVVPATPTFNGDSTVLPDLPFCCRQTPPVFSQSLPT